MYLGYGLLGLIIGFLLGIFIIKLKTSNLYRKNIFQKNTLNNLEKIKKHQKELNNFFNQSLKLLDIIANDYQMLHQHVLKNSNIFLTNDKNIDKSDCYNDIINTNQFLKKIPRDYPEK